jgi:hypothetical protein
VKIKVLQQNGGYYETGTIGSIATYCALWSPTSKVWMGRDGFADLAKQRKVFVKGRFSAKAICR